MNFERAFNYLQTLYPDKFVTLRYERTLYKSKETNIGIHAYVDGVGWSKECKTFRDAIEDLSVPSNDCGVDDGTGEFNEDGREER